MLDAGLGTLYTLKSRILPTGASDSYDWDASLSALGMAVAARMQSACNRLLARAESQADEFCAATTAITLSAYPVEGITSIKLRDTDGTLTDFAGDYQLDQRSGLISFSTPPGSRGLRLVITYSGGYWLADGDSQPAGSTALPDDLHEAWIMQCQAWAEARNLFGTISLSGMESKQDKPSPVRLTEDVTAILNSHRRFSGE